MREPSLLPRGTGGPQERERPSLQAGPRGCRASLMIFSISIPGSAATLLRSYHGMCRRARKGDFPHTSGAAVRAASQGCPGCPDHSENPWN